MQNPGVPPGESAGPRLCRRIVVLGGTGDLATRHLLPAVALLADRGLVGDELEIWSLARDCCSESEYRQRVGQILGDTLPGVSPQRREWLVERLRYRCLDLTDTPAAAAALSEALGAGATVCYLALPPSLLPDAVRALASAGQLPEAALVVEKPFGEDAGSARRLNRDVHAVLAQHQVFRADHFLHHQVVQDVLALRLGGGVLDRLWRREHVEAVEIVWEEAGAAAGRVELFDRLGSIRDMVQSHLLQLLALVAMEPPATGGPSLLDAAALSAARLEVLRAIRTPQADRVGEQVVRGRYTAGEVPSGPVTGYADEPGIDTARGTETYVGLRLEVALDRWRGVPFVLRTGKAVGAPRRFVDLRLRGGASAETEGGPASVRIELHPPGDPARVSLGAAMSGPDGLPQLAPTTLTSAQGPADLPATARLLREVLAGRQALFPSGEEVEECWRIADAVLAACGEGRSPLHDYPAGSAGPPTPF